MHRQSTQNARGRVCLCPRVQTLCVAKERKPRGQSQTQQVPSPWLYPFVPSSAQGYRPSVSQKSGSREGSRRHSRCRPLGFTLSCRRPPKGTDPLCRKRAEAEGAIADTAGAVPLGFTLSYRRPPKGTDPLCRKRAEAEGAIADTAGAVPLGFRNMQNAQKHCSNFSF